jgi:hypothetical protein
MRIRVKGKERVPATGVSAVTVRWLGAGGATAHLGEGKGNADHERTNAVALPHNVLVLRIEQKVFHNLTAGGQWHKGTNGGTRTRTDMCIDKDTG